MYKYLKNIKKSVDIINKMWYSIIAPKGVFLGEKLWQKQKQREQKLHLLVLNVNKEITTQAKTLKNTQID